MFRQFLVLTTFVTLKTSDVFPLFRWKTWDVGKGQYDFYNGMWLPMYSIMYLFYRICNVRCSFYDKHILQEDTRFTMRGRYLVYAQEIDKVHPNYLVSFVSLDFLRHTSFCLNAWHWNSTILLSSSSSFCPAEFFWHLFFFSWSNEVNLIAESWDQPRYWEFEIIWIWGKHGQYKNLIKMADG